MTKFCRSMFTAVFVFCVTYGFSLAAERVMYVYPEGSDSNPGTLEAPFATLERARDAVRDMKGNDVQPSGDIIVYLRGGIYRQKRTVIFDTRDSGGDNYSVVYSAYPGENPVVSGGFPVTGWRKLETNPPGLPPAAAGRVWIADIPSVDGKRFYFSTLFAGNKRLPRARSAGFVPSIKYPIGSQEDKTVLHFPENALKNRENLSDIEVLIRPTWPWVINYLGLESVDEPNRIARTVSPGTYQLGRLQFGLDSPDEPSAWVENVMEALDDPGEWVMNSVTGKLYLIPESGRPADDIIAPVLTELIRIEGDIRYEELSDIPVRNIEFRGITFTQGDRFRWEKDRIGWGLQHDWEMFDRPTALVRLRGAEGCAVVGCSFVNSGGTAIRLDLHCMRNRIVSNNIERVGGAGILLAGYGPGTKDVNKKNEILNNHIHQVGEVLPHSAAIFVWQSGENRIANNLIHHTPYTGIIVSGRIGWDRKGKAECSRTIRWREIDAVLGTNGEKGTPDWHVRKRFLHGRGNIVELNDIHHVMEVMHDGDCIYISGTGAGNIVRHNYLHDNVSPYMCEGIRCDDDQHETTIEGNILFRNRGSGIAIKGVNHIINNMIVDYLSVLRGYLSLELGPLNGSVIARNIIYSRRPGQRLCFQELISIYEGKPEPKLRDCAADYNLYFNAVDPDWGRKHLDEERQHGIEENSISADPLFADIDGGDLSLDENSPAWHLGFQRIPIERIGLYSDIWRQALPGTH